MSRDHPVAPCARPPVPTTLHLLRERRGMVGMGGAIYDTLSNTLNSEAVTYSITLGLRVEQNLYTAELAAISMAIRCLLLDL